MIAKKFHDILERIINEDDRNEQLIVMVEKTGTDYRHVETISVISNKDGAFILLRLI